MVEQKYLVEQKAVQIVPPSCPAGPSCGTAPMSKITIKPLKNHNIFFARTNLLMNVFNQFWLSGGRQFGSPWGAIWSVIRRASTEHPQSIHRWHYGSAEPGRLDTSHVSGEGAAGSPAANVQWREAQILGDYYHYTLLGDIIIIVRVTITILVMISTTVVVMLMHGSSGKFTTISGSIQKS